MTQGSAMKRDTALPLSQSITALASSLATVLKALEEFQLQNGDELGLSTGSCTEGTAVSSDSDGNGKDSEAAAAPSIVAVPAAVIATPAPAHPNMAVAPAHFPVQPGARWYAITRGVAVGVFEGWVNVAPLVSGHSGACYARHPTRAAAEAAYQEAVEAGTVLLV